MSRGRVRKRFCRESFVDEIQQVVQSSLSIEKTVSEAFRHLSSTQLTIDVIRSLPTKVLSVLVSLKYEQHVVSFVTSSLAELSVLPTSLRAVTVAKVSGLSVNEVCYLCI